MWDIYEMKIHQNISKSEKIFVLLIALLTLAIVGNTLGGSGILGQSFADEGSGSSEGSSSSSDDSASESSTSSEDEASTTSSDEVSTQSVDEISVQSIDEVSTFESAEVSTPSVDAMSVSEASELSTESSDTETSSLSTASVVSVASVDDELSVKSGVNIGDLENVIPLGDDTAIVVQDEKLFFLIPIQIEKTLTLDENGVVLSVQQTLINRILSWLSF